MLIDKNAVLGEDLSLTTAGVIGNAIDLGAANNIGAGANRTPVLHIAATADTGTGELQLCVSDNGTTATDVLVSIPYKNAKEGEVVFSGMLPTRPKASGRYILLKNNTASTGKVSAFILNSAPAHHIYPGK